ncbi:hypothetical protein AB0O28_08415 [Microbispora sp. NPDC088329]|uniref:hypothetical protein n=1 Tax=Microbispora sp. NPDC088329 TaxID=3154869 RepID=UPI0034203652
MSTSEATVSRSAPHTRRTASVVAPPANTDNRRNATRSSGDSRPQLQSITARNVRCRDPAVRPPRSASRSPTSPTAAASCRMVNDRNRAAARSANSATAGDSIARAASAPSAGTASGRTG